MLSEDLSARSKDRDSTQSCVSVASMKNPVLKEKGSEKQRSVVREDGNAGHQSSFKLQVLNIAHSGNVWIPTFVSSEL